MSEARYRSVEVRAGAEEGRLDGYAAVWGAAYEIGHRLKEVIARGAFGPEATIPLYVQHRHEAGPVGHATVTVDHHGARVTGTVYVDSDQGLRVWKAAKAGALRGLSVGFLPRQVSRENRDGEVIETVEKAELLETSVVLKGASPEAQIVSVRSQQHVPTQQPPRRIPCPPARNSPTE